MAHATDTSSGTTRRDFLMLTTGAAGAIGVGALLIPLVSQLAPDAQTVAAGAPIDVDLGPIAEGQSIKLFWRGKLIFVRHRTPEGDRGSPFGQRRFAARSAGRPGPRQGGQGSLPRRLRQLHPSRLRAARQCARRKQGRLRWLVLPLPRLALRFLGPHPQGSRAAEPAGAALCLHRRHQDQDRLSRSWFAAFPCSRYSLEAFAMSGHSSYVPKTGFERWLGCPPADRAA